MQKFFSKNFANLLKKSLQFLQLAKIFINFFARLLGISKKNLQIKSNLIKCSRILKKIVTGIS